QPQGADTRVYYRVVEEEGEEVPVDGDGRILNELTYLGLPLEEQGNILYFAIRGRDSDGDPIEEAVEKFAYLSLEDSLKGEIRYFRKLVGKGGEFPFDAQGNPLTETAYNALPRTRRGAVVAAGELVRVRFRASVLLNGTTVDAAIRDSAFPETWQQVDPGDATGLTPGAALSIAVPFSNRVVQEVEIAPNPFTPNADGINDRAAIRFSLGNLNTARTIRVEIFDLAGRQVWSGRRESVGQQEFAWDGRGDDGRIVAPGVYMCRIDADVDAQSASNTSEVHLIAVAY
ncbi:MAG: gliding motility-associated C-terminal domain-containing protein, partial [Candidatus Latescibacterota bacterium]|nr:gliding motility-associated C-terminal domain-containing protein [Candidatus Latescibacterota bacterium]